MRMTEQDYKRLTRKARKCGLTKSGYIRQLIHDYKPREAPPADYYAMTRELKEIGNNMNQIAFMANATGLVDEGMYYQEVLLFSFLTIFQVLECAFHIFHVF